MSGLGEKRIKLSKSSIGPNEKKAVRDVLDSEFLGMGPEVKKFEDNLAMFFKRPAVCVSNGTAALQLAIQSLGIGKGDEVLVQSLTYLASFQSISANGARPIPCDIDIETGTINIEDAEKKINNKTKAIMPVHYAGNVGRLKEVYDLANKYNLRVIEDAAHAFGSYYDNNLVGSVGDIVCFSFDGIKNITAGEGGCVVTSDKKVLQFIKDARLLGVVGDTKARFKRLRIWKPEVKFQGWRYHMSDIMAAIGIVQLSNIDNVRKKKNKLIKHYISKIKKIKKIKIIKYDVENIIPHIFVIRILKPYDRDVIRTSLSELGIETGIHYFPNHKLNFYSNLTQEKLENTNYMYKEILSLPFHNDLTIKDIKYVCSSLSYLLEK